MESSPHRSIKRLADFVASEIGFTENDESWLSIYLGNTSQIPRVYTTRAHTHELAWWHQQNGIVVDGDFGTEAFTGHHIEGNQGAEGNFESVSEMTVPFVNERTGMKAAVMLETYDLDAFLGAWGQEERRVIASHATRVANFLGFFQDESQCKLILPEGAFSIQDLETAGISIVTDVNDQLLRRLRSNPKEIHNLTSRAFEKVISRLLLDLGFHIWLTPEQKDGGRDIIAVSESEVGTVLTLVECKKYRQDRPVSIDVIRGVYGVLQQQRATNALIVTTSRFTKDALEFRDTLRYQIALKDADDIMKWLSRYS